MNSEVFDGRLPFILNTIGESPKQGAVCREKAPEWNQFIWVKSGSGVFTVGDEKFTLSAGQGIFMRHGVPHSYDGENLHTAWCTFFSGDNLIDYNIGKKNCFVFRVPDFLERETAELCVFATGNSTTMSLSAAGYTYVTELFAAITGGEGDSVIEKVKNYLESNFSKELTLDGIAAAVGLDRFSLCRYFKKYHKRTVMEELKKIRISKAKKMLRYTSEPIEKISKLCGFESHGYFCMRFRELCGCAPGEYRKKFL